VRVAAAVLVLLLQASMPALAASDAPEQTVTALPGDVEQRVDPLTPGEEQHVQVLDGDGMQHVVGSDAGPVRRGLGRVTKFAVGVLAAGVSLGVLAASLLLL
jgi:hypothetical protein